MSDCWITAHYIDQDELSTTENTVQNVQLNKIFQIIVKSTGNSYTLHHGLNTVGRSSTNDIYLDSQHLSKEHAEIELMSDGGCFLRDLNSRNLTYRNKIVLRPQYFYEISTKDVIQFANIECFLVESKDNLGKSDTQSPKMTPSITPDKFVISKTPSPLSDKIGAIPKKKSRIASSDIDNSIPEFPPVILSKSENSSSDFISLDHKVKVSKPDKNMNDSHKETEFDENVSKMKKTSKTNAAFLNPNTNRKIENDSTQQFSESPKKSTRTTKSIPIGLSHINDENVHPSSSNHVLVFSSSGVSDEKTLKNKVEKLGGRFSSDVSECDVLVCELKLKRTIKLLKAIARGIPVVEVNTIKRLKSLTNLNLLEVIVSDRSFESQHSFNLKESIESSRKKHLLEGYSVYIDKNVSPSRSELSDLVVKAGGKMLMHIPKEISEFSIVIGNPEEIGTDTKKAASLGFSVYSPEFLLSSLLKQKLDFTQNKIILNKHSSS